VGRPRTASATIGLVRELSHYGTVISAIERGLLWKHESGSYVKFTQAGAAMFA
jgi:hypothetical protein